MKLKDLLIKKVQDDIQRNDAEIKYLLYRKKLMLKRLKELQSSSLKPVKASMNPYESEL